MVTRMNQPLGGKYVGSGGVLVTPEQVAQQKQIAAALLEQAGDTSPVGHWSAALNRGLQGWIGGRDMYRARQAESEGTSKALELFNARNSGAGAASRVAEALAGGVAAGQPVLGDESGFLASLVASESGGNWNALNKEGYGGRLQFGAARLADAARAGVIPAAITGAEFSRLSPEQQMAVEQWHFNDIDQQAERMGLGQYIGQTVAGIPITREAIRGMAHLGGIGGAAKFLQSGGRYNPADSNGTSLADYALRHGGVGAGISSGPSPRNVSEISELLADPWLPKDAKAVLQAEMNQQIQMQNAAYEMQLQQQDPLRQIQLQQERLKLQQMQNPGRETIEVGGVLLDKNTLEPLYDSRTSKESEREAEIARGMSIGLSREDAIKLADGMTRLATNPITGEHQIIDMATNQIVPIAPPQQQGVPPVAPQEVATPTQPILPDARLSFGLGGAARGLANSAADTFGLGAPYPEEQAAQSDFAVLRESLLNDIASAYDRQPPSWLLEVIRELTPEAGSITQGAGGARSKLESLRRNFTNELATAEGALQNNLSPERRQKAVEKVDGIRNALARIDRGLTMLEGGNQGQNTPATSTGVKWRIVD